MHKEGLNIRAKEKVIFFLLCPSLYNSCIIKSIEALVIVSRNLAHK